MTDRDDMQETNNGHQQPPATTNSRRSFLKKGAVVSVPLVFTAFSRPVLAMRCGLSGLQSGNLSGQDDTQCEGGGSPGYWKTHANNWPKPLNSGSCGTDIGKVNADDCSGFPLYNSSDAFPGSSIEMSLMDVLRDYSGSAEFHLVAALLNYYYLEGTYALSLADIRYLESVKDGEDVVTIIESTYVWD